MDKKTLETIAYFRVLEMVSGCCMSEEGRELLNTRLPFTDSAVIRQKKQEAEEWFRFITTGQPLCLTGWPACRHLFSKLGVEGFVLEASELYNLGTFCRSVIKTKKSLLANPDEIKVTELHGRKPETPALNVIAEQLPDLTEASNAIFRVLDENGEIRDLPEIRAIKNSIKKIRNEIDQLIRFYTGDNTLKDALQSNIPVLRQDRQVLAVKANYRGRIKGIVHEVSQTGQTVFIEPEDVVQKNNSLVQAEYQLAQEIKRILRALTAELGSSREAFETAHTLMLRLDTSLAAARWGIEQNGTFAFEPEKPFNSPVLLKARHPLLGEKAVPIDVIFDKNANNGKGHRILLITGPNTGGKTVTLKTLALLAMLNQSGFPVPAAEGTVLPVFTNIFADIGDSQSLDESLSTFSGHMKSIADILQNADENSLVLLDELGSGTDPQEGGAIAMAVLDELIEKDSFVLITTHHGILKNYGYTHPSCINASVEFNTETLSPTYRIIMGVPGESHALEIADKSGIPKRITEAAEKYISNNQADISALIKGLNEKHTELAQKEKEFAEKEKLIHEKWRKTDLKALRVKQHEMELKEQGYKKSRDFLDESRKMLENLVRELREGEITREKTLKVKETLNKLSESVEKEKEKIAEEKLEITESVPEQTAVSTADFKPGQEVIFGKNRTKAVLLQKTKNNCWQVRAGSMKLTVKESDLVLSETQSNPVISIEIAHEEETSSRVRFGADMKYGNSERPVFELRLLGMRYEQAVKALEHQLDLCAIHNFKDFSIIHGKGNGVLQEAVQNYLKNYSAVKEFHFARPEDGGTGKTYVTLK